jgi:hypothetical protein
VDAAVVVDVPAAVAAEGIAADAGVRAAEDTKTFATDLRGFHEFKTAKSKSLPQRFTRVALEYTETVFA